MWATLQRSWRKSAERMVVQDEAGGTGRGLMAQEAQSKKFVFIVRVMKSH